MPEFKFARSGQHEKLLVIDLTITVKVASMNHIDDCFSRVMTAHGNMKFLHRNEAISVPVKFFELFQNLVLWLYLRRPHELDELVEINGPAAIGVNL